MWFGDAVPTSAVSGIASNSPDLLPGTKIGITRAASRVGNYLSVDIISLFKELFSLVLLWQIDIFSIMD